eukprot:9453595-Pyramimonas_sp.AAC.2
MPMSLTTARWLGAPCAGHGRGRPAPQAGACRSPRTTAPARRACRRSTSATSPGRRASRTAPPHAAPLGRCSSPARPTHADHVITNHRYNSSDGSTQAPCLEPNNPRTTLATVRLSCIAANTRSQRALTSRSNVCRSLRAASAAPPFAESCFRLRLKRGGRRGYSTGIATCRAPTAPGESK